jgi:type I restriction enzyme M protein
LARRPKDTEVDAYVFIKDNLRALGWDARNPERVDSGQVYTQNECLSNPEIQRQLGLLKPENIVKVTDSVLWVIEAKRSHSQLDQALIEAEDYARKINKSETLHAKFITGVAGNELDTFLMRSRFLVGDTFVPIKMNGVEISGLLSQEQCNLLLRLGEPNIENPPIDEKLFLSRANHINEILHLGAVNPHQRASVMAALLLATLSETEPNINERNLSILIGDINARVKSILRSQGKAEFYDYIRISPPATEDNHTKFRRALVSTLQELNSLNIRSAMNSGADWLGAFYEVFLKYASWAQDLGIVLTPRHITRWVAEVMGPQAGDYRVRPNVRNGRIPRRCPRPRQAPRRQKPVGPLQATRLFRC